MALHTVVIDIRDFKVDPFFRLVWEGVLDRNLHLTTHNDFSEVLFPSSRIFNIIAHLSDFFGVRLKEQLGVEGLERLLPHLHDKEVGIESILTLLGGVRSQHRKHRVDSDQLVEMRAV